MTRADALSGMVPGISSQARRPTLAKLALNPLRPGFLTSYFPTARCRVDYGNEDNTEGLVHPGKRQPDFGLYRRKVL